MPPRALIFDLYDTLIHIGRPVFQREVSRLAPAARRAWVAFERDTLMVTPYTGHDEFVRVILERFQPGADARRHARVGELLREELDSVALLPGARPLLQFLRRRGMRLGVLSNAASPYREPLVGLGLAELFDAAVFSCDEGTRKPDRRLFATVCERLGVAPAEAVMVGDSLVNDVRAAADAGLQAILVRHSHTAAAKRPEPAAQVVAAVVDLAWRRLADPRWGEPLLPSDVPLALAGACGEISSLQSLPDAEQGR
jgi:HAD superfamily hydrolase (TIGR01509 family)